MSIYKYMSTKIYNKGGEQYLLKYIFEDNTLRFTSPLDFNDPFEFQHSFKNLNPSESGELNEMVNSLNKDNLHKKALNDVLKNVGTLCLSGKNDDILMWAHYADSHKGIVLEFDEQHDFFKNKLDNYKLQILPNGLEEVNYVEHRLIFEDIDSAFLNNKYYLTKNKKWENEAEYRMSILFDELNNTNKYNIKFPTDLIKAIYLGINTDKEDVKYIKKITTNEKWKHIKIYKFVLDRQEYKIHPYEI